MKHTLRGAAAIVGVGESPYYRHGRSPDPEFVLVLRAVKAACADAGIDPRDIDGFSSYSMDRNGPVRLAAALGVREFRYSVMHWDGGGGGMAAAVAHAAMGVATGQATCVVVLRGLAQGEYGRYGQLASSSFGGSAVSGDDAFTRPYGIGSAGQMYAFKFVRWMHEHGGVGLSAQKAVALASYHHAQHNPRAVMYGRPLTADMYDRARMIVEPWRLYDFCQESDGGAAVVVTTVERARTAPHRPAVILAAAQGAHPSDGRGVYNSQDYASATFTTVAPRLWEMAGMKASDVDVIQSYENFTGAVVMSLVEHGFCAPEAVDEVLTFENLTAPSGRWPLNTSGGNLAEAYMHGLSLTIEGVRQLRGTSDNQVPDARVALVSSGPLAAPVSSLLLGTEDVL
jgi:acetyl-CoA acetyltransferase